MTITREEAPNQNQTASEKSSMDIRASIEHMQRHNVMPQRNPQFGNMPPNMPPPLFGGYRNNQNTMNVPKGSVMDSVDLFVGLAKRDSNDVMSYPVKTLHDVATLSHDGTRLTTRRNNVVFMPSPHMYGVVISLPSGIEILAAGDNSVSSVMMQLVERQASEDDMIAFAEAIDILVGELREKYEEIDQMDNES